MACIALPSAWACLALLCGALSCRVASGAGLCDVDGTVKLTDAMDPAGVKLILTTNGSELRYAWPRADNSFVFHHVPAVASYADNPTRRLSQPLLIRPLGPADYFEIRKPFDPIAFIKTPYGLMIGFAIFALFVLPKLKVDPEEYQELLGSGGSAAASTRGSPAPALGPSGARDGPAREGGAVQRRRER
ncbi:hypothetical protein WJX81_006922 [Elliptochloris bilobata]|uniref:ER membrane protein complex subunit 7 beta-sandwich domain-containing protein n=1 Tax=Elliptochloris bilobata TaxID=381761 RepID=A0AAW1QX38_9CHLO